MPTSRNARSLIALSSILTLAISLFHGVPVSVARAGNTATLKVTEINWAGSSRGANDQWVELYNDGVSPVDFSTEPTAFCAGTTTLATLGAADGIVAPNHYIVLHQQPMDALYTNSTLATLPDTSYSLEPTLVLPTVATSYSINDTTCTGTVIDQIGPDTTGVIPFAGSTVTTAGTFYASMSRVTPEVSGSLQSSWYTTQTVGIGLESGSTTQYGTPGALNAVVTTPTMLTVTPIDSVTMPAPFTVAGQVTAGTALVTVTLTSTSFNPTPQSPIVYSIPLAPGAMSFTKAIDTTTLAAGRYDITVQAQDVAGNLSPVAKVTVAPSTTTLDYVVIPATSVVVAPTINTYPAVTNLPGLTLSGTLDTTVPTTYNSVDVLRNGEYYASFPAVGNTFSGTIVLVPNSVNVFQVMAVRADGMYSTPAVATITHDSIAPNAVVTSKVVVSSNPAGTNDSLLGLAGAAEPNATISFYGDAALTQPITSEMVAADGSFAPVSIGDNQHPVVYMTVTDAAGNVSAIASVQNAFTFIVGPGVINPQATNVGENQVTIQWNLVPGAVKYRVRYEQDNGTFSTPTDICVTGNTTCTFTTSIQGLTSGTGYVVAIAAVDQFGNESSYATVGFTTASPAPVVVAAPAVVTPPVVRSVDRVITTPATTVTPTPTPATPTPTPDAGQVKSASTTASKNWTPWIILGVLIALAVVAALGYFYWFGGEAGEAALASAQAVKEKEPATKPRGSTAKTEEVAEKPTPPKAKRPDKDKRW